MTLYFLHIQTLAWSMLLKLSQWTSRQCLSECFVPVSHILLLGNSVSSLHQKFSYFTWYVQSYLKREKYDLSLVTCQHKSSLVHSSPFRTMIVMYVMTEWKCTFDKPPSPKYCSLAQSLPFTFAHDYQPSHISLGLKAYTHYGLLSVTLRYNLG